MKAVNTSLLSIFASSKSSPGYMTRRVGPANRAPRPNGERRYFDPDFASVEGAVLDQVYKFFLTRSDPTYQQPKAA